MNKQNNNVKLAVSKTKCRDSNLELFRIITMLLIVAHHYVVNSGLTDIIYNNGMTGQSIFLLLFGAWGKTGINCFVLITGYFMCKSEITAKKFAKLLCEIMFYRIVIYFIFIISGYSAFSWIQLIKVLIPVRTITTGFTGCYIVFFLCIPFLNILVRNMKEIQHVRLILLCSFIYIFIGTIPGFDVTMNYVSWFIVLYFIASYIRLYPKKIFDNTKFWGWMAVTSVLVSALSVVVCTWLGMKMDKTLSYYFVIDSNKVLAVITAMSAFMFFKNVKIKYNRFINTVAASAFGVLLIHANSDTMRQWLWKDVLQNTEMYYSPWLVVHAFGSVLGIYVVCTVIDYLRIRFVEKVFFSVWDKQWDKFLVWFKQKEIKLSDRFNIKAD